MHHRHWQLTPAISTALHRTRGPNPRTHALRPSSVPLLLILPTAIGDHIIPCPSSPGLFPEPFISWRQIMSPIHTSLGLRGWDIGRGGRYVCNVDTKHGYVGLGYLPTYAWVPSQWRSELENGNKSPTTLRTPTQRWGPWTPKIPPHPTGIWETLEESH